MSEDIAKSDTRWVKFQVWGWRVTMIWLLSLFIFSVYISDGLWIMNSIVALLVMLFCGRSIMESSSDAEDRHLKL